MLPGMQLAVYTTPTGSIIADWTSIAIGVEFEKDEHGYKSLSAFIPLPFAEAMLFYNRPGTPHLELTYSGSCIWQGRIEDVSIVAGGISIVAFGYYRAFADQLYTATHTAAAPSAIIAAMLTKAPLLSSVTKFIQNPGTTITERYEDLYPVEILERLVKLGDDQTPPRMWEVGVDAARLVYFRPQSSTGKTWYVDSDSNGIEINRSLEQVYNSVYAVYSSSTNQRAVTANSTDAPSISQAGLTREAMVSTQTRSSSQAGRWRDAYLDDHSEPTPNAVLPFKSVFDSGGNAWPLWAIENGDTIIDRSLPPAISSTIDKISVFRIKSLAYSVDQDEIKVVPESPIQSLEEQVGGENSATQKISDRLGVVEGAVGAGHNISPNEGGGLVPATMIGFFPGDCPTGWTEYTSARGRFIVGVPSGGTVEGTVGSALTNLGTRTISTVVAHTHTEGTLANAAEAAHTHGAGSLDAAAEAAHTHSVNPPSTTSTGISVDHTHAVDPPNTTSSSDGAHDHDITTTLTGAQPGVGASLSPNSPVTINGAISTAAAHTHTVNIASFTSGGASVSHTHTVDIAAFDSAAGSSHDHVISGTSAAGSSHNHTISGSTASTGSATVDVTMPYLQLRLCQKD